MCDYSFHGIKNRLAQEGEVLVLHRFRTGSNGLPSPEYLKRAEQPKGFMGFLKVLFATPSEECAVCIPDGARLVLGRISAALQEAHGLLSTENVTFRQLSANAATHRVAVEFKNGVKLRLQDLDEGQAAEVLSLSSEEADVQERRFSTIPSVI
jgi:hypothetical protein